MQLEPASGYKRGLVFQSSSSFLAGCSFSCQYRDLIGRRFQSSPNLSAGCSHSMVAGIWDRQFQSSTQPIGWVQPVSVPVSLIAALFQSSPNLSVGCRGLWTTRCFNPHPTSRLGAATDDCRVIFVRVLVSILTQSLGWAQRAVDHPLFQSSPNLSVGCSQKACHTSVTTISVSILTQPRGWVHRSDTSWCDISWAVSILTQPRGWVQILYLVFLFAHRESPVLCPPRAVFREGMSWRLAILQI